MPELQKLSGSLDGKETGKPKRQASKKGRVDYHDDNTEKPTTGEEGNLVSLKSKKGAKAGAKGRKPSKQKNLEESDEDNDSDAGSGYDSDQVEKKNTGKATNGKQAAGEKQSKKRVQSNQTSRNAKRKAK